MMRRYLCFALSALMCLSSMALCASAPASASAKITESKEQTKEATNALQSPYLNVNEELQINEYRKNVFDNLITKNDILGHKQFHKLIHQTLNDYRKKINDYETQLENIKKDINSIKEIKNGIKSREEKIKEISSIVEEYSKIDLKLNNVESIKTYLQISIQDYKTDDSSDNEVGTYPLLLNAAENDFKILSKYNEARLRIESEKLKKELDRFKDIENITLEKVNSYILANKRAINDILEIRGKTVYNLSATMDGYIFTRDNALGIISNYINCPSLINALNTEELHKFLLEHLEIPRPMLKLKHCQHGLNEYLTYTDKKIRALTDNMAKEVFHFGAILNFIRAASDELGMKVADYVKNNINIAPTTKKDAYISQALFKDKGKPITTLFEESAINTPPSQIFISLLQTPDKKKFLHEVDREVFTLFLDHIIPPSSERFFQNVCASMVKSNIYSWSTKKDLIYEAAEKATSREDLSETIIQSTYNLIGGNIRLEALKTIRNNLTSIATHKVSMKKDNLFDDEIK